MESVSNTGPPGYETTATPLGLRASLKSVIFYLIEMTIIKPFNHYNLLSAFQRYRIRILIS